MAKKEQSDQSEWEVSYCIPRSKIVRGYQKALNFEESLKKDGCVSVKIMRCLASPINPKRDNKRKGGGIRNYPIGVKNKRRR